MRLLKIIDNDGCFKLESFSKDKIPPYAILSHTWGGGEDDEVTYKDIIDRTGSNKPGFQKLMFCVNQAKADGLDHFWVDTCCIDKASSAELTEAINSMFGWYQRSQICYAYLSDFTLDLASVSLQQALVEVHFRECRWFTRGWCLQELLAPRHLQFFNQQWQEIGTKSMLSRLISDITGVPEAILVTPSKKEIQDFPIAARISWIAKRQTTRIEDMSYSLLGILQVNIPMLYGEGPMAFIRLQEEVIRRYNDLSIFAWTGEATASGFIPILAATPSSFVQNPSAQSGSRESSQLGSKLGTQFSLTNQGVFFPNAKLQYQGAVQGYRHHYLLDLNYRDPSTHGRGGKLRYILLQKIGPGLFIRIHAAQARLRAFQTQFVTAPFNEPACILNNLSESLIRRLSLWERYAVRLRWKPWEKSGRRFWHIRAAHPRTNWDLPANQFLLEMASERHMHAEFVPGNYESNPDFKHFVLVIQVGDDMKRDPLMVSVRIVSTDIWQRLNTTMFGFQGKEALAIEALQSTKGGGTFDHISLVGYDISVSVQLVREPGELPYHHVYLDWKTTLPQIGAAEAISFPSTSDGDDSEDCHTYHHDRALIDTL
jgi:hypothetical protein